MTTRLRSAWGLQRSGARIEAVVTRVVELICSKGEVVQEGAFLVNQKSAVILRNRQNVQSAGLRKPEMLPPQEIASGIKLVVKNNLGATDDEIVTSISRMFGFKATSSTLRKVISDVIETLLQNGELVREESLIVEMANSN